VAPGHDAARHFAESVQFLERDHVGVGGDLKHTVRGRIHDGRTGGQMLVAQFGDDLRTRSRLVAQCLPSGRSLEAVDNFRGEALGVGGERRRCNHSHVLPVPGGGVLARRQLRQDPRQRQRLRHWGHAVQRQDVPQTQSLQNGHLQGHEPRHVPQCVGAHVTVGLRVGQGPGPHPVEHHDEEAAAHEAPVAWARGWASSYTRRR